MNILVMYHTQYMYTGVQVHIGPEYIDVGIQYDLPVTSSNAGVQFGLCPLGASSPRTIPTSCSESELSYMDDNVKVLMHQEELITHPTRVNHRKCNYWLLMNQCVRYVTIMIAVQWKMMFLLFLLRSSQHF